MSSFYYPPSRNVVSTINGLSGAITLAAGSNITITPSGNTLTIASTGGGGGGAIVDTGSFSSPQTVASSGSIAVPTDQRGRIYVSNTIPGTATSVVIDAGSGTHELYIIGTDDTRAVQMSSSANVILSGVITLNQHTTLYLQWVSGLSQWLEVSRNEI